MTGAGLERALMFLKGVRPNQPQPREMSAAWALKLARYDDDLVMQALFDLAERPTDPGEPGGLPVIQVGDVVYRCKTLANRRAIDQAAQQRDREGEQHQKALEAGDGVTRKAWGRLSAAERAGWLTRARDHVAALGVVLPDDAGSALAKFLAAGGDLDAEQPREPIPFPCRGCGRGLVLVDAPTDTAKCDGCGAEFVLPADWRQSLRYVRPV